MGKSERLLSLDALRGVSIFLVLGRHLPMAANADAHNLGSGCLTIWQRGGWIGVDLFFVLSGFLVSGLLFREHQQTGGLNVSHFLVRRAFKIYPAFYMLLGCSVAALLLLQPRTMPWTAIFCEALFIQNYGPAIWNHTWSLAVEEHFYLLLALSLVCLRWWSRESNDPFRPLLMSFAVIAVVSLSFRLEFSWRVPFGIRSHLFPTHFRLDSLSFGAAISYLYHFRREWFTELLRGKANWLLILALVLLVPPFVLPLENSYFLPTLGLTCLYVAGGLMICAWLSKPLPGVFVVRGLAWIGYYSYSIYLWHCFVLRLLTIKFDLALNSGGLCTQFVVLYVSGSVLLGVVMAKLVELPFVSIRDRWFPSQTSCVPPTCREVSGQLVGTATTS